MNRYPIDIPPRWWSPQPRWLWMQLWKPIRRFQQKRQERIERIDVVGLEHVKDARQRGYGVLMTANHPGHADGYLLFEAFSKLRTTGYVVTTWQVFQMARRLECMQYRQHGCFSIDRDGADRQAFRQARDVLANTNRPLVIFPEGEVYHLNERVTPFREGAAAMALAALKRSARPIACVPTALKYTYVEDVTPELCDVLTKIESQLGGQPQTSLAMLDRIERVADAILARLELRYFSEVRTAGLPQRITELANQIVDGVDRHFGTRTSGLIPQRIKVLRQLGIRRRRELPAQDPRRDAVEQQLEELFLALQLYSYPGDYVREHPSLERLAETIDKLEEDVLQATTASVRGKRRATITFGVPTLLTDPAEWPDPQLLTDELQRKVQQLLDATRSPLEFSPPVRPRRKLLQTGSR